MNPLSKNIIPNTDIKITQLGFGAGSLGDPFEITTDEQAQETIKVAFEKGINYYDTAPWYGNTKSEHRLGYFLRNKPRKSYVLNTKVGRIYHRPYDVDNFRESPWMKRWKGGYPFDLTFDYTANGIRRSYEDSIQRLGINRIDFLTIHDLDFRHQKNEEGVTKRLNELESGGGYQVLRELKSSGEINAIGAGINHVEMIPRFLERFDIDFFLVAMPYTLMDQGMLDGEFELCQKHGSSVIIGAVYCSGILARGVDKDPVYAYQPATIDIIEKVRKLNAICYGYNVPLGAVALQFPLGHEVVKSVIPGPNSPQEAEQNWQWMQIDIPEQLWLELKSEGLIRTDTPTPSR